MTKAWRRGESRFERFGARLILGLSVAIFSIVAQAQQTSTRGIQRQATATTAQSQQDNAASRRIQALRVREEIKIDGLLNEPAWSFSQPATNFLQEQPNEGEPASEKTEVRVLFDDKNLKWAE